MKFYTNGRYDNAKLLKNKMKL